MQKSYCDLCGKEITPTQLGGGIMRTKEIYPVLPIPGGKLENQMGQMIQKRISQEVWDLCQECQSWVWKMAEEKKNNLTKILKNE